MATAERTRPAGRRRRRSAPHRKGTAMTEFVLVVPFLGLILALTFILGWVLMHKHQVLVAGRHAAWRRIETGSWPSEADLDTACFADKAQDVQLSGSADGLRQTPADLVSKVGSRDNVAMSLARQLPVLLRLRRRHAGYSRPGQRHGPDGPKAVPEPMVAGARAMRSAGPPAGPSDR